MPHPGARKRQPAENRIRDPPMILHLAVLVDVSSSRPSSRMPSGRSDGGVPLAVMANAVGRARRPWPVGQPGASRWRLAAPRSPAPSRWHHAGPTTTAPAVAARGSPAVPAAPQMAPGRPGIADVGSR